MAWNYWFYDSRGKLTEFRRGSGTELQNHELGFKYDNQGRLLGFEYRQGADDKTLSRTEISYSSDGKTVVVTTTYTDSKIIDRSMRTLDDHGRVVREVKSAEGRPKNDEAKDILFRYDQQGRLIEQTTDATKLSDFGAENDLPPGTISIAYDDEAQTKTTTYSVSNKKIIQAIVTQDDDGATTGYSATAEGKQYSWNLKCGYDRFANWTRCRQIVKQGGKEFTKEEFRRTITYR